MSLVASGMQEWDEEGIGNLLVFPHLICTSEVEF